MLEPAQVPCNNSSHSSLDRGLYPSGVNFSYEPSLNLRHALVGSDAKVCTLEIGAVALSPTHAKYCAISSGDATLGTSSA